MTGDLRERLHDVIPPLAVVPDRFERVRGGVVRRRRRQVAGGVTAALAVLATAVPLALASPWTDRAEPDYAGPDCPATMALGPGDRPVPPPAMGVDAAARLVPAEVPRGAVLCSYFGPPPAASGGGDLSLQSAVPLAADGLPELAADLSTLPQAPGDRLPDCWLPISVGVDGYLLRVDYAPGHVWVYAQGLSCPGTTNGTFASPVSLDEHLDTVRRAGRWLDLDAG